MAELIDSGRMVDLILGLVLIEAIAIAFLHRATGRGLALADLLPNLLAGVFLLLALRAALVQAGWIWIALALSAALLAHLGDLWRRWRR